MLRVSEEPDAPLADEIINPTGLHAQMEGLTEQTFHFISFHSALCYRTRRYTRHSRRVGMLALLVVFVFLVSMLPILYFDFDWGLTAFAWLLSLGYLGIVVGIISTVTLEWNRHKLKELALTFGTKKGIDAKLNAWKKKYI